MSERITPAASAFFTIETGELMILGDAADNTIIVGRDAAGALQVNGGGIQVLGETPTVANTVRVRISGLAGNDTLSLDEANGVLPPAEISGGAGNDTLIGGSGSDVLTGGGGDDQVFGNAGNDRLIWNVGDGSDAVDGMAGRDSLVFNGSDASEHFEVSANGTRTRLKRDIDNVVLDVQAESIDLNALGGADTIDVNDLSATDLTALNLDLDSALGTGFGDNASDSVIINGTAGNDAIQIASFGTRIAISGLFPFVNITGEDGLDTLKVSALGGDDMVDAANLAATNASELIRLTVEGGAGNDTVTGSQGFDTFVWNAGDGNDAIDGGVGADTMVVSGLDVAEKFAMAAFGARVRLTHDVDGGMVDFGNIEILTVSPLAGADTVTVSDLTGTAVFRIDLNLSGTVGGATGDGHADSVVVDGTDESDLLPVQGTAAGILVNGGFVSQHGLPYFTFIRSVEPTDALRINGGGGDDRIEADTLQTAVQFTADGGAGNDEVKGSSRDDLLIGGDGEDFVDGNGGADLALLGAGRDTFQWDTGDGSDVVEGQDGDDKLIVNGSEDSENFDIAANNGRIRLVRDVGDIAMDLDGFEEIVVGAFGGSDSLFVTNGEPSTFPLTLKFDAGAGDNTLVLQNGSARIDSTAMGGSLDTTVEAGAHLSTGLFRQNGLTIGEHSRVTLLPNAEASVITNLVLAADATLDIGTSALVLDYTGQSPVAAIRQQILAGRGGLGLGEGVWTGAGITSSAAAAANQMAPESRSVGFAENALLPLGRYANFRGIAVDETAILIAFTRTGDASLDGVVNDNDVTIVGAMYAPGVPKPQWALGDFDYNGFVDDDDVTLLGAFYDPLTTPVLPPPAPIVETFSRSGQRHQNDLIGLLSESLGARIDPRIVSDVAPPTSSARLLHARDYFWVEWQGDIR